MEKTLQQQYVLIKEGKGDKDYFLKSARRVFPEFISPLTDYNTAVNILKGKSVLSEGVGGIATQNPNKPNWFKIFDTNLAEAVGVKNKKEYGDQNEFEKIDKDVQDVLDHNFDNKDPKNIDNLYGQSFLLGYLTEMGDPKNANKTVDELKAIVAKNMAKDINYYHTNAFAGIKGIGYKTDVVGGGEPKAPTGKYKSSGYGDLKLKESIERKSLIELLSEEDEVNEDTIEEGPLDDAIAAAEKVVAQKKKETADAEKKLADAKAKEASAEAAG
jgi:hypothetical protein